MIKASYLYLTYWINIVRIWKNNYNILLAYSLSNSAKSLTKKIVPGFAPSIRCFICSWMVILKYIKRCTGTHYCRRRSGRGKEEHITYISWKKCVYATFLSWKKCNAIHFLLYLHQNQKIREMERDKMQDLIAWKNKANRKPLIIRGARQVGKTWLIKEFGRTQYKKMVYVLRKISSS